MRAFLRIKEDGTFVKKQLPGWAALLIITLVAGLALGCTYALTIDPINEQNALKAENARKAVLPLADSFQEMPLNVHAAKADGFAGPVYVEYVPDEEGKIASITIGNSAFAETPGFGAKALEPAFADQFIGKSLPLADGDIDLIAGATITSNAVISAVNAAQPKEVLVDWCYAGYQGEEVVGYVAQATVQGFGGPVEVVVGVDTNLTLTGISVGGGNFSETAGLGAKAKDSAFTDQFIGKVLPVSVIKAGGKATESTVDAITSATITSNAVAGAVNTAANHAKGILFPGAEDEIVLPEKPEGVQIYSASAQGFAGPVYAEAAFDAQGKISYFSIGNDQFKETDGFGAKAKEPAYLIQYIGLTADEAKNVDAISGATVTSGAIKSAVEQIAAQSQGAAPSAPAEDNTTGAAAAAGEVKSASAQGYAGPVYVEVTLDAEGKIASLKIGDDQFAETPFLGGKVKEAAFTDQFTGKVPPLALSDIDAVANATITSQAVVNAINAACGADAAAAPAGDVKSASAQGYAGPVYVEVTLDAEGKIASLKIGDDQFAETPFLGGKVKEAA
ncbi:MAG: FMN-binding protein, partial [Clostridia bacterium]|nr:FMN-binding protein [Clostridia bacterium]